MRQGSREEGRGGRWVTKKDHKTRGRWSKNAEKLRRREEERKERRGSCCPPNKKGGCKIRPEEGMKRFKKWRWTGWRRIKKHKEKEENGGDVTTNGGKSEQ